MINNIKHGVDQLCNKFESNEDALNILNQYISNNVVAYMNKYESIQKEIDEYIIKFLYDEGEKYYYIIDSDTFIEYKNYDYIVINEDVLWHEIYSDCFNDEKLNEYNEIIKDTIISKIKEKDICNVIPESNTIQKVINFFSPLFCKSKEDVKYFLSVLGDIYFWKRYKSKAKINLTYYVPEYSRPLIEYILNSFEMFFNYDLSIKFKYKWCKTIPYEKSRIIKFKQKTFNNPISNFWIHFLNENILNIFLTGIHYSVRYNNSDNYASKQLNLNYVFYLKNYNEDDIINEFKQAMLIQENGNTLAVTDIYFLWKLFLDKKSIPLIMYKQDFLGKMGQLININSQYLEPARYFTKFWSSCIECYDENDDELEISELTELYAIWLKEQKNKIMKQEEYHLEELIKYFHPNVSISNRKYIKHITCTMWNKKRDIKQALDNKFDNSLKNDVTKLEAFRAYCGYADTNNFINIASKNYFKKYILQIIPKEYIKNNKILKEYWTADK